VKARGDEGRGFGGRRSEVGGRRSEVGGRRSEVGGRRSEGRGQRAKGDSEGSLVMGNSGRPVSEAVAEEPTRWEPGRETVEDSPPRAAPLVGSQVPSNT